MVIGIGHKVHVQGGHDYRILLFNLFHQIFKRLSGEGVETLLNSR